MSIKSRKFTLELISSKDLVALSSLAPYVSRIVLSSTNFYFYTRGAYNLLIAAVETLDGLPRCRQLTLEDA